MSDIDGILSLKIPEAYLVRKSACIDDTIDLGLILYAVGLHYLAAACGIEVWNVDNHPFVVYSLAPNDLAFGILPDLHFIQLAKKCFSVLWIKTQ